MQISGCQERKFRTPFSLPSNQWLRAVRAGLIVAVLCPAVRASDHADPIDFFRRKPLEPVITDLFVFPVDQEGKVVEPFEVTDGIPLHPYKDYAVGLPMRPELKYEDRKRVKALVVILCVRRMLTQSKSLNLAPYRYVIHMDTASAVSFDDSDADMAARTSQKLEAGMGYRPPGGANLKRPTGEEARVRYGGLVGRPDKIKDNVRIEMTLNDDASLKSFSSDGLSSAAYDASRMWNPELISVWTGIRDDPFIFPPFFGSNVVAMIVGIPLHYFESDQLDWLVWATSHRGSEQIDHVGRSLRTQNPRFEILNKRHPREHVAVIEDEIASPALMRDLELFFNLAQLAAYRPWDKVPDVMIFSNRYQVGYPNGRVLTDDVAALLAQHGDTLLLELSHNSPQWPRATTNDKPFQQTFPYLADPWPDKEPAKPHQLSMRNQMLLLGIAVVALVVVGLAIAQVVHLVRRWKGIKLKRAAL